MISRDEMIKALVDSLDTWDVETLMEYAKLWREQSLKAETDATISMLYSNEIIGE